MNTTKEKEMMFREAWFQMLNGKKIKLPLWSGYWAWENGTIMMHCKDGKVLDIRETDNPAYTFSNVASREWEVVTESSNNSTEQVENLNIPIGYRLAPEYKSARIQLLVKPATKETIQKIATVQGLSMNELINRILDEFAERQELAISWPTLPPTYGAQEEK